MPISEMQSRWIAKILSEELQLPSQREMEKDIERKKDRMHKQFQKSSRHTIQVEYISFMDELASLIGVKPKLWRHPSLFLPLIFGVVSPLQYRLDGPGRIPDATKYIKQLYRSRPVNPISPKLALFAPDAKSEM